MVAAINSLIQASIQTKERLQNDPRLIQTIHEVVTTVAKTFLNGQKVLFCGNGGSAADAQHLAAEFSGRFYTDRAPLPAEALHCNTSYLTAVANDYSYDVVYSRLLRGIAQSGDVLIALSTSGNSTNIVNAVTTAREIGMVTVALTGQSGGALKPLADFLINIPSADTPRIQEAHILVGHIICQLVEQALFSSEQIP